MRDGFVKVAAATPRVQVADCEYNGDEILGLIGKMAEKKAKVMVFPELCLTGYTCEDLFWKTTLLNGAKEQLLHLAKETKDVDALIFIGMPLEYENKLLNVAAVLNRGEIIGFVPKSHLANYEARQFCSGECVNGDVTIGEFCAPISRDLLFRCEDMPEFTVAAEICEDLWVPNPPSVEHALAGARIMVNLSAVAEAAGKDAYCRSLVMGQSARLVCGYICAVAGEGESTQDLVFGGQNLIAENGILLKEGKRFENDVIYSDVDLQRLGSERRQMSTFPAFEGGYHRTVPFKVLVEETDFDRTFDRNPFVPADAKERDARCDEILNMQALGLKKRMQHVHGTHAVVGLSGGLDSTLALLVIARAFDRMGLPRNQILTVTMPCFGTTDRTYTNACVLAERIGAKLKEVDIKEAVTVHLHDIGQPMDKHDVTYENAQARERTQVLMDLANQNGALVVGTGDLSELALGWATYNGDHMSMYGVNGSVPKTLVRHLVSYCAKTSEDAKLAEVLRDILDTPVSPELLPPKDGVISQKTEDLVGPYELHDFFLYYMLRANFAPGKIYRLAMKVFAGIYEKETILKWLRTFYWRFFTQQFKRSCLPDGPKVGSVAVSPRGDLRMPSDASVSLWIREIEALK